MPPVAIAGAVLAAGAAAGAMKGMRTSKSGVSGDEYLARTATTTLPAATPEEQALAARLENLGVPQDDLLRAEMARLQSGSPYQLSAQDAATLDAAYQPARERLALEGREYADYLAGSRGLRMSDTPIAQQALQRYGLGLAELEGQRAASQLTMGFMGSQYRTNATLGLGTTLPAGTQYNLARLLQLRLAQPTVSETGRGSFTRSGSNTASPLEGMSQGMQLAGGFLKGIGGAGAASY